MNRFRVESEEEEEENCSSSLFLLPTEILEKIFSFLSYDEISAARLVSKKFDCMCRARLNEGLSRVDRLHSQIHREIKGKLPRRESERRNHVLARHIDILGAIETRLSLLNMTYSKYMEMGLCCFIPGKVLDEIFQVLRKIRTLPNPPRAHELLQELRDISSMAIEHFDEKIAPLLRKPQRINYSDSLESLANVQKARKAKLQRSNSMILRISRTLSLQQKLIIRQNRRIGSLQKQLVEETNFNTELQRRQSEQNRRITELEQKIVDYDQKFVDMIVEISRVRGASGGLPGCDGNVSKEGKPQADDSRCDSEREAAQSDPTNDPKASSVVDGKTQPKQRKSRRCALLHDAELPMVNSAEQTASQKLSETGSLQLPKTSKSAAPRQLKRKAVDCNNETLLCPQKIAKQ